MRHLPPRRQVQVQLQLATIIITATATTTCCNETEATTTATATATACTTSQRRLTQYDFVKAVSGQDFSKAFRLRMKGMRLNGPALIYLFAQGDAVPFFQDATGP